jgi:hypothetical protein
VIRLQFATQGNPAAWIIRFYEHGWASHVDAILPDGRLIGARWRTPGVDGQGVTRRGGLLIRPAGYAPFSRTLVMELVATPDQEKAFYDFLIGQLGKPYDLTAILAFAFERNWRENDSWFCSEAITAAVQGCGLVAKLVTPSNRVTVDMCMFLCSALRAH